MCFLYREQGHIIIFSVFLLFVSQNQKTQFYLTHTVSAKSSLLYDAINNYFNIIVSDRPSRLINLLSGLNPSIIRSRSLNNQAIHQLQGMQGKVNRQLIYLFHKNRYNNRAKKRNSSNFC